MTPKSKVPQFKPLPPPAAPPPPPEESAAVTQGAAVAPTEQEDKRKRSSRNSLRIDLNTGGATASNGLNIPS